MSDGFVMMEEITSRDMAAGCCPACEREVLTHVHLAEDGVAEVHLCVHCDTVLSEDLRTIGFDELEELGLSLIEEKGDCGRPGCGGGERCEGRFCFSFIVMLRQLPQRRK